MAIETIKDILDWTRDLHGELSELYQNSSEETDDERLKMLLTYIAEHEQKLAEAIDKYEHDSGTIDTLDSWFQQYTENNPFLKGMKSLTQLQPFDSRTVLDYTVQTHQNLINLYRELGDNARTDRIKTLFDNLASMELHDLMRMVHTSERMDDM